MRGYPDRVEQEIEHLDFEVEKDEGKHYNHPIDGTLWWCGKVKKTSTDMSKAATVPGKPPSEVTCSDCLHLYIEKGGQWWWGVNRAWYGS